MARTVLFADDSPTIQKRASGILTGEGLEVVTVSNGIAAIKKLPTVKPQLVLADVSMPGKDGYEVCEFVKNSAELLHVPVLLVVNVDEPYDEQRGAHVGADGMITKPFNRDELISTVAKLLAQVKGAELPAVPTDTESAEPAAVTHPANEEPELHSKGLDSVSFSQGVAFAEPPIEQFPKAVPEPAPAPPEPTREPGIASESTPPIEFTLGRTYQAPTLEPPTSEPVFPRDAVLIEDPAAVRPSPPHADFTERASIFPPPSDIAEPPKIDVLDYAPPPAEPQPAEVELNRAPVAADTPESFTLGDTIADQARFASSDVEANPAPVAAPPEAGGEAVVTGGRTPAPDETLIRSIIHQVVAKMSPPALPPYVIEEIANKFSEEIIAEITAEPPQRQ